MFNSTIKGIHLTLEIKISFDNSVLMTVPAQNLALRSMVFPLTAVISIAGRDRRRTCTSKSYKAKLERLCSARLIHQDQTVRLLYMQMASSDKNS
jgi:hypothetical protein